MEQSREEVYEQGRRRAVSLLAATVRAMAAERHAAQLAGSETHDTYDFDRCTECICTSARVAAGVL
jgi:hypothetical protein